MTLTPEQAERKRITAASIKETEEHGPCDNPNPALVCFAQSLLPTVQVLLKESNSPTEGLITALAVTLGEGIGLTKHSGEWALLAKEQFETAMKDGGFDKHEYPDEDTEVFHAFTISHPLDHANQEQDIVREKSENEGARA